MPDSEGLSPSSLHIVPVLKAKFKVFVQLKAMAISGDTKKVLVCFGHHKWEVTFNTSTSSVQEIKCTRVHGESASNIGLMRCQVVLFLMLW